MNIALFATGVVGEEIARFLAKATPPRLLVLDSKTDESSRDRIRSVLGKETPVLLSDALSREGERRFRMGDIDLAILAWWPYILKDDVLRLPRVGTLNFHPSLLPYNRGKHYNFWNLVEDVPFGVTIHWVDNGIDSGDIAFQEPIAKTWEDTGGTLYAKAQAGLVELFKRSHDAIALGQIPRIPQDAGQGSFHLAKELHGASEIKLERSYRAADLLNLVRARTFPPHPAAWFVADGQRYEVRVEITRCGEGVAKPSPGARKPGG